MLKLPLIVAVESTYATIPLLQRCVFLLLSICCSKNASKCGPPVSITAWMVFFVKMQFHQSPPSKKFYNGLHVEGMVMLTWTANTLTSTFKSMLGDRVGNDHELTAMEWKHRFSLLAPTPYKTVCQSPYIRLYRYNFALWSRGIYCHHVTLVGDSLDGSAMTLLEVVWEL